MEGCLKLKNAGPTTAMVFAGRYLPVGEGKMAGGAAGRVRFVGAASGAEIRVIEAPDGSPGFGYDLAEWSYPGDGGELMPMAWSLRSLPRRWKNRQKAV